MLKIILHRTVPKDIETTEREREIEEKGREEKRSEEKRREEKRREENLYVGSIGVSFAQ